MWLLACSPRDMGPPFFFCQCPQFLHILYLITEQWNSVPWDFPPSWGTLGIFLLVFFFLICEIQNIIAPTWEAGVTIKTHSANQQTSMIGDGQVSLECCSPWGRKESDTTEQLNWTDEVPTEKEMNLLGLYFNFSWILCLLQFLWVWGFLSVVFSWPYLTACAILVLWAGTEPAPLALEVWSLNHWTTREAPGFCFSYIFCLLLGCVAVIQPFSCLLTTCSF